MRTTRPRRTAAAVLAAALALALGACGNTGETSSSGTSSGSNTASAPGVTATEVKVGGHFPLTGPAAAGYSDIPVAIEAVFDFINDNGGVNGRRLSFVARDDAYNPTTTVRVTRQLVLQDKIFAMVGGLGTPTHSKVTGFLNASRVPDLFASSGAQQWDDPEGSPYTFGWLPEYTVEGKILGAQIAERFPGQKVGIVYQDDDFGEDGMAGLDRYIDDQVVGREGYQPGVTDMGPQIGALRRAGAEVIVLLTTPTYTALAHLAALQLDYEPQFVATSVGSDPVTLAALLEEFSEGEAGSSLTDGLITDFYLPSLTDDENSWSRLFQQIHERYMSDTPYSGSVEYGMGLAYTFAQALEQAGRNPTRESIVEALESGDLRGPTLAPFRYSADSHAGVTGTQMGTLRGGELVLDGPVYTTDDGDEPIEELSADDQPEAPTSGWRVSE